MIKNERPQKIKAIKNGLLLRSLSVKRHSLGRIKDLLNKFT